VLNFFGAGLLMRIHLSKFTKSPTANECVESKFWFYESKGDNKRGSRTGTLVMRSRQLALNDVEKLCLRRRGRAFVCE